MEILELEGFSPRCSVLGIPDTFVEQGPVDKLFKDLGIDDQGIAAAVKSLL